LQLTRRPTPPLPRATPTVYLFVPPAGANGPSAQPIDLDAGVAYRGGLNASTTLQMRARRMPRLSSASTKSSVPTSQPTTAYLAPFDRGPNLMRQPSSRESGEVMTSEISCARSSLATCCSRSPLPPRQDIAMIFLSRQICRRGSSCLPILTWTL